LNGFGTSGDKILRGNKNGEIDLRRFTVYTEKMQIPRRGGIIGNSALKQGRKIRTAVAFTVVAGRALRTVAFITAGVVGKLCIRYRNRTNNIRQAGSIAGKRHD